MDNDLTIREYDNLELDSCIVCQRLAIRLYDENDPATASCGRVECELTIQTGIDFMEKHDG